MNTRWRLGSILAAGGLGLFLPFGWLLAHLPARLGLWVGQRVGDILWLTLPGRRAVAMDNIRRAFGSERSEAQLAELGRRSFEHLGMNLVEACVFFFRHPSVLLSRVDLGDPEPFQAAVARGKGVLALSAHYGNWELLAAVSALSVYPLSVVMRPLDDPFVNWLIERFRRRSGVELIAKRQALPAMRDALRQGRIVGVLLDQNASRTEGVFVPFFGRPASTSRALAILSLRTGAPVVPIFIRRSEGGRHCVWADPAIPAPDTGDVADYTAAFNRSIEAAIRRAPEQWFWLHRRWKTEPHSETA
ncbi:MAG TPA: lysophospholipid acyltransferase family protein [Candidatus Methylomirabilis sp.]|nr:lysophospholipid acyltransferase family protein [Candidatus Methylomirabilis sp.]